MVFDIIRPSFDLMPMYAHKLVDDIPDEQLCRQPVPGVTMNHAAFLLGHLAWANDNGCVLLGHAAAFPAEWKPLFVMGATPLAERDKYPSKAELLGALDAAHARLAECATSATPEAIAAPTPERVRARFPTVGNMVGGLMTGHYANHLGQLSAWRRACGFKSVF